MSSSEAAAVTRVAGPSPRTRAVVALLLRLGIGLQLLNAGVNGFHIAVSLQAMGGGGPGLFFQTGVYPGSEGFYQVLPYLQISVALAVLLGFFTRAAAVAAAVLMLIPTALQSVMLLVNGTSVQPNFRGFDSMLVQSVLNGSASLNLIVAVMLIYEVSSGFNAWSLDGLMTGRRAASSEPHAGPGK